MSKVGRPRSIEDPSSKKTICAMLQVGATRGDAARFFGISVTTIADEMKRDAEFSDSLIQAEIAGKLHHIKKIHGASHWQASAWYLERKFPEEYSKQAVEASEMALPNIQFIAADEGTAQLKREIDELKEENIKLKQIVEND